MHSLTEFSLISVVTLRSTEVEVGVFLTRSSVGKILLLMEVSFPTISTVYLYQWDLA